MLTTDTHLHLWSDAASKTDSHLQEFSNTVEVDCCKWIVVVELLIRITYIVSKE